MANPSSGTSLALHEDRRTRTMVPTSRPYSTVHPSLTSCALCPDVQFELLGLMILAHPRLQVLHRSANEYMDCLSFTSNRRSAMPLPLDLAMQRSANSRTMLSSPFLINFQGKSSATLQLANPQVPACSAQSYK